MDAKISAPEQGDGFPPALAELYAVERTTLVRTAALICGSNAVAEEIVHDAVVAVSRLWPTIEHPRGYLFAAVANRARSVGISSRRREGNEHRSAAVDASGPMADVDGLMSLSASVKRLPDTQREAVVLRYYLDWSFAEIAAAMRCREATARSLVHRAIRSIRKEWT